MYKDAEMVGLYCAASVLGMISHCVVTIAAAGMRRCRDRYMYGQARVNGPVGKASVESMT